MMKKYSLLLHSCLFILISCNDKAVKTSRVEQLPYYTEATFTPNWLTLDATVTESTHQIPAFSLQNQLGNTITEATFKDKIYVTDFFFTFCSGICPKMTDNMKLVQEAFKDDEEVLLLSHSVTPEHDTPEILQAYAAQKGVIPNKWHLVTGTREDIYDLGRNHYFVEEDLGLEKGPDEFLHTENFILVDQNRHIRGIYNGLNKASVAQLIADIKTLQSENL